MRLIFTSDWHLGAGHRKQWPRAIAQRRRAERARTIRWVIDYARSAGARFLVVVGDVCDPKEPAEFLELRDDLQALEDVGCTPLLFFNTHGSHDRPRDWWEGPQLGPQPDQRPEVAGRPLGGTFEAHGIHFSAHDHLPEPSELPQPSRGTVARVVLVHGSMPVQRVAALRPYVALVVGGHHHACGVVSEDFAFRAGSPMFRDLSSFDPGPRYIADVTLDEAGHVTDLGFPEVPTELSVKARFEDGILTAANAHMTLPVEPVAALRQLSMTFAYIAVKTSVQEEDDFKARVAREEGLHVCRWTSKAGRVLLLVTRS